MRHKISGRKLNRKTSHRIALLKNLAKSLILNEQIETTLPKAKELRRTLEPLITLAKEDNVSKRRMAFNKIRNKNQKPNQVVELEQFISIKGVKAIGNQLTSDKVKQINILDSIPYEPPLEIPADEIEVVGEKVVDDDGQTALF